LWQVGTILPNDSPLDVLTLANLVTVCLENQKNGHKNALLHHTSSHNASLNPVKSAAILIHTLHNLPETTQSDPLLMISRAYSASLRQNPWRNPHWCHTHKPGSTWILHVLHQLTQQLIWWSHAPQISRL
jgi:hypothetical protein